MTSLKEKVYQVIQKEVSKEVNFLVDVPDKKATTAHLFSNVAFVLAKIEKNNPLVIADKLAHQLKDKKIFSKVENQNGFLNFWISDNFLKAELKKILKLKNEYGFQKTKKGKIQIEFVSANPTGPLTLANGRGGFYGDVLANVLESVGWNVEREYYVNDTGNQILLLGKSILAHLGIIPFQDDFYQGEYVKEWAKKNSLRIKNIAQNPLLVGELAAQSFLKDIQNVLEKKANIRFDRYTSEKKLHLKNYVSQVFKILKKKGYVYEKENAFWLKTTIFGDDKDRVLITKEGKPTYFLADGGHYLETKLRGFQNKINILGPDHYGYVKRLEAISKILGFKQSEVLITQAILIKKGEEFLKMSKRRGSFVTFEDLILAVGKDVARFFFLSQALNSHIEFDLELAKEKSSKNPLFYVEYAYVRAFKILQKTKQKPIPLKTLNDLEREIIFNLSLFPSLINEISKDYLVHKLIKYSLDLAKTFHNFYEQQKILGSENEKEKLSLILALILVFQNVFYILGIQPPKKM